ncbi:energy transducer TonB [Aliiglaciecola sp. LCG003]|uniref:energy transducer TonB n=1 Tax=Aliiglaciecola sp. LCG003 TaxID=3053655 RepID=UPI002572E9AD|nr:energy transducer TonB [Aliiglaciecola sp. LCG003]WJG08189.1 energy transducer TonB [Aliiglaciecola sp. LCG003]
MEHAQQAYALGKDIYAQGTENAINLEYNLGLAYSLNNETILDDIEPTPLYRKAPEYPVVGARHKKNGSVLLSFDIDDAGFVKNINMEEEDGGQHFVKSSIEALNKWRYGPKIIDGKAVNAENMRVRLDFKIDRS